MATIKEVAELANVSVPTVYKVFDENYTTTDEIRKRVLKASKELVTDQEKIGKPTGTVKRLQLFIMNL